MTPRRKLFLFLIVATALRWLFASQNELAPDEAYYAMWSERLDICYYSKGPGIAATIWAGTHLFGMNEFGIRFFAPLLALGTSLIVFHLGRRLYDETVGVWAAFMVNCLPIFNAGALIMTIDALSIFFWAAAVYTFWRALEHSPAFSGWWPGTGALIGLGFLCKYTNAMQLVSIALLLAITRKYRRELVRPGFLALIAAFLPCTLPPLIWNAQHDWITIGHLSARGGLQKAFTFEPGEFFAFILQHFGVYSILIFALVIVAVVWAFPLARQKLKPRFLLAFGLPLWALYLWLALKQAGEANWTAPAMVSLGILATALWIERARTSRPAAILAVAALTVGLATTLLVLDTDALRRIGVPLSYDMDPSKRMRGWRTAARQLEQLRTAFEQRSGAPAFLIGSTYGVASDLGFYLEDKRLFGPGHPPIYFPESPQIENQFSFWPRYDEFIAVPPDQLSKDSYFTEEMGINPFHGRNALYVTDRGEERPPSTVKGGFERTELIACIDQKRRGLPLRQWRVFACYNYRSLSL